MKRKYSAFIAILAAVFVAGFFYNLLSSEETEKKPIAALVNGEPIYFDEIAAERNTLPDGTAIDDLDIINFIAEKKMLLQVAREERIEATPEEVTELYAGLENPEETAASYGLSIEEFTSRIAEQATINKILEIKAENTVLVDDEKVRDFYEENYADSMSFEDAELMILHRIASHETEKAREQYVQSLRENSVVDVLI